jgi:hypothetical protein
MATQKVIHRAQKEQYPRPVTKKQSGMNPISDSMEISMNPVLQKQGEEPWLSGLVSFESCEDQMDNFFMIPENAGDPGFHPTSSRVGNIDGFWFKYHTPKNEWWKIPGLATTYVTCTENEEHPDIRPAVRAPLLTSGWSDDGIHVPNPF